MTGINVSGQGLVLTARTIRQGLQECVEIWLATDDGPVRLLSPPEATVCFVVQTDVNAVNALANTLNITISVTPVALTTFEHCAVASIKFQQERHLTQFRRAAEENGITLFEADIKTPDRYLMERFVTLGVAFQGICDPVSKQVSQARVKAARYHTTLSVFSIDIECDEKGNLYSIGIASLKCNQVLMIGKPDHNKTDIKPDHFELVWCQDERALLAGFIRAVDQFDPDILLGWNVKQFDFPVLNNAAKRCGLALAIGRGATAADIRVFDDNRAFVSVPGRIIVDGIEGLKSMSFQFDSFSLNNVATRLLGKQKLIDSPDKLAEIKRLFKQDKIALATYNFEDCALVLAIAEHVNLIDFLVLRSDLTGLRIGRPGGSVASFINLYLPKLHRAGYVSPNRPDDGGLASPGGYVMNSKPGLYKHVLVLDFKSLYPSIIRTFNIDPLGLIEGLKDPKDAITGFKGAHFHRDKHFLPAIIDNLWQQRDEAKRQQDTARSQAIKILMNSFYGVLGSGGCPFYDTRLASSITLRGHEIMQTTANWIREQGYEVIYGDTDSTFVHLVDCQNDEEANRIGLMLQDNINQQWQQQIHDDFNLPCWLEIEFETHFETFFMPTIRGSETGSKKRYAGLTRQHGKTQIVFKGLENVRSDWTALAKTFQETLYLAIFSGKPVSEYINEIVNDLRQGQFDTQLLYTKQLRKPLSHYTKSVPPHVKAARHADNCNQRLGKPLQYQQRTVIHYVMTTNGPQVPEYQTHLLDYDHYVDKQIRPIADSILHTIGQSFDQITSRQIGLL